MEKYSHRDLIKVVDEAVLELGIDQAVMLIQGVVKKTAPKIRPAYKVKLISEYLVGQAIDIFELEEADFLTNNMEEAKDARMCCFHLLKKYTKCSYPMIARVFESTKRSVMYYRTETEERLRISEYYKPFTERYRTLEDRLLRFMATLEG